MEKQLLPVTILSLSLIYLTAPTTSQTLSPISNNVVSDVFIKKVASNPVPLPLAISVKAIFTESLNNPSSQEYAHNTELFNTSLTEMYKITPGFFEIKIKGFRNGSIVIDFDVVIGGPQNIASAVKFINASSHEATTLGNFTIIKVDTLAMKSNLTDLKNPCNIEKGICGFGYTCKRITGLYVNCISSCLVERDFCGQHGQCYIDFKDPHLRCRCLEDDGYAYSGERCDTVVEKLKLKSTYIIAIGAGSGGVLLIVFAVITIILVKRHKSDPKSRPPTVENIYESRLPSINYVDGQDHTIAKDDHISETYLNQPSCLMNLYSGTSREEMDSDVKSTRSLSTYGYIDTETKFKIKRPHIRSGNV